jgi:hypothetical protein
MATTNPAEVTSPVSTTETARIFTNVGNNGRYTFCNQNCQGPGIPPKENHVWGTANASLIPELKGTPIPSGAELPFCSLSQRICLKLSPPELSHLLGVSTT